MVSGLAIIITVSSHTQECNPSVTDLVKAGSVAV